ncbi:MULTISPECIES: crossover junction endodeoxyribonuclease RuvC [Hyphomonas]|jgi:crossover junction endodeoxyribonuclease RuvC|uniref:Crossover junction endodeoxyribonuclease RuvC n=1 Tax=Hyphomonas adhaerens TaxID=81029 RepID=A0A3B9H289_9PROT|nr:MULTISPECIES: crossover junction endodeoxyribonuclease RuvC [Hyphomonas]MBB39427.1 crossover junction endodeoxyribonuclease RuvC [Hyphomonas sp.]HAE28813.1 crossover junction endodeoxyribonuclease RuvC [Hyphomonas adhaerens]|tara:strand:+ start:177 stop:680 length:504 start_codon:yes stop_codon:yes gene_type:complete
MTHTIRILGIDPGLRHTGWGVIELSGMRLTHIAHGVISIDPKLEMAERLGGIFEAVGELARYHQPTASGVEETLVNANPRSALKLGQARGAAMAALAMGGVPVAEFAPRKIKLAVVGTGTADKDQVMFMVRRLLPKAADLKSDSADALACAICAAHHLPTDLKRGAA